MKLTNKRLKSYKKMVTVGKEVRPPDLLEAAFIENGFSVRHLYSLLSLSSEKYEEKRKNLSKTLTIHHFNKICILLKMDGKDLFEIIMKNSPINRISEKDAEVILARNKYGEREIKW